MKKLLTIVLFTVSLSVNAFWGNNNSPWGGGYNNYNNYGYQQDNGIFGYNPYEFWEPSWYFEEMSNMFDEFDNNGWNNNNNDGYGYGYNPYNSWNQGNNYRYNSPVRNTR
ncbi:hypothetical protein [uncultured Gammaproteobacteria bacterium]|nr:hypothetical protein [uncultured Gammaproteobacteria bacterium]